MNGSGPNEAWWRDGVAKNPAALDTIYRLTIDPRCERYPRRIVMREYRVTNAWRIDLLILWAGSVTIVEFKREIADEAAVAQVLRYMGALTFYSPGGVIVARGFTQAAKHAAYACGVDLLEINAGSLTKAAAPEKLDSRRDLSVHTFAMFEEEYGRRVAYDPADDVVHISDVPWTAAKSGATDA
jgi:hypothetical protein